MSDDEKFGCFCLVVGLLLFALAFAADMLVIEPARCAARFPDMTTEYSVFGGCRVRTEHGLIPAENFRVM